MDKSHVALIAFPYGTHAPPLFALARAIAEFSPTTVVSFLSTQRSISPFKDALEGFSNLRLIEIADGIAEGYNFNGNVAELIGMFLAATPGNIQDGLKAAESEAGGVKVTCILSDAFLWVAGEVADGMSVPWIALWTGGTAALSSHIYTDLIRLIRSTTVPVDLDIASNEEDVVLSFVPGLSRHRVTDLPEGVISSDLNSPMSRLLHQMGLKLPGATAVVLNTFPGLEPAIDEDFVAKFRKSLPIGPLHLLAPKVCTKAIHDPSKCLSWLDGQAVGSVAYISFGSMMTPSPTEVAELSQALASNKIPFLWSLKEDTREHLPKNFLKETSKLGLVTNWAPQQEVLGHRAVGVSVTHCGWNSVTEAVSTGVPMICRPFFADQRMNTRSVSEVWKIGVMIEGGVITKDGIVNALNVVLKSEEGKLMKERAEQIKDYAASAVGVHGPSFNNFKELVQLITG